MSTLNSLTAPMTISNWLSDPFIHGVFCGVIATSAFWLACRGIELESEMRRLSKEDSDE